MSVYVSDTADDHSSCDVDQQQITERRGELLSVILFSSLVFFRWMNKTVFRFVSSVSFFFCCTFFFLSRHKLCDFVDCTRSSENTTPSGAFPNCNTGGTQSFPPVSCFFVIVEILL